VALAEAARAGGPEVLAGLLAKVEERLDPLAPELDDLWDVAEELSLDDPHPDLPGLRAWLEPLAGFGGGAMALHGLACSLRPVDKERLIEAALERHFPQAKVIRFSPQAHLALAADGPEPEWVDPEGHPVIHDGGSMVVHLADLPAEQGTGKTQGVITVLLAQGEEGDLSEEGAVSLQDSRGIPLKVAPIAAPTMWQARWPGEVGDYVLVLEPHDIRLAFAIERPEEQ